MLTKGHKLHGLESPLAQLERIMSQNEGPKGSEKQSDPPTAAASSAGDSGEKKPALKEGSAEFFKVVEATGGAGGDREWPDPHAGPFGKAWAMYNDGHRLSAEQFEVLQKQLAEERQAEEDSGGWDEGAKEAATNLYIGIAIAKGEYANGKPLPTAKRC